MLCSPKNFQISHEAWDIQTEEHFLGVRMCGMVGRDSSFQIPNIISGTKLSSYSISSLENLERRNF